MISAKFGPNRTNRFNIITLFLNFNRASAAILDFAHIGPVGITSQNASGCQIDQYGMAFISANFRVSIAICSILIGKVPLKIYIFLFIFQPRNRKKMKMKKLSSTISHSFCTPIRIVCENFHAFIINGNNFVVCLTLKAGLLGL